MLTGKGNQYFLTKSYEEDRRKALLDRDKYDDTRLEEVDVLSDVKLGSGRTDPERYEVEQFPFPMDQSIRKRKTVSLLEDSRTGGQKLED